MRWAVVRFTVSSLVALIVLTAGTILIAERIARHQALEYASAQGAGMAHRLAAPLVNLGVRRNPGASSEDLDFVMSNRMADGSLSHVKLWDADGRIIWADDEALIGRRFELEDDVAALFGTSDVTAEVSDLSGAENVAERDEGRLLEVYAGAFDADGVPLVFEAYLPVDRMEDEADAIVVAFVPLVVGALVLFLVVMLPLAVSLARRVQRAQHEQSKMMRHALLASDLERRRIAADLHDGVIQDLAGLGYVLPTTSREFRGDSNLDQARSVLERATSIVQHDTALLRAMIADLYPPNLEGEGLRDAIEQLVQSEALAGGLVAELSIPSDLSISHEAGRLTYRIIREALRNVVKHAQAHHLFVDVKESGDRVLLRVQDDGRGPGADPGRSTEGHLGLRLLRDTLTDFGGDLEIQAADGGGTKLVATFPSTLVPT